MPEIYGNVCYIEFQPKGELHKYTIEEVPIDRGDYVLAYNEFGLDVGKVQQGPEKQRIDNIDIQPIVRKMTDEDWKTYEKNLEDSKEAFKTCKERIKEHRLPMRLLEVRYMFDRSRIVFYFGADSRVDFRELVKDLAHIFKTRIELRQVGIRDEVKMKGNLGLCGQVACCTRFLREFQSITLKHAKKQQLLINPAKISGRCGRLLCCLSYEQDLYNEELKNIPDEGSVIEYNNKTCKVLTVNIFLKMINLVTDDGQTLKLPFEEFRKNQNTIWEENNDDEEENNKNISNNEEVE
ncbi:MAG: regulatory iron-sulfur-containing complex subunit RicT [Kosmotogaceae bacterium]